MTAWNHHSSLMYVHGNETWYLNYLNIKQSLKYRKIIMAVLFLDICCNQGKYILNIFTDFQVYVQSTNDNSFLFLISILERVSLNRKLVTIFIVFLLATLKVQILLQILRATDSCKGGSNVPNGQNAPKSKYY